MGRALIPVASYPVTSSTTPERLVPHHPLGSLRPPTYVLRLRDDESVRSFSSAPERAGISFFRFGLEATLRRSCRATRYNVRVLGQLSTHDLHRCTADIQCLTHVQPSMTAVVGPER